MFQEFKKFIAKGNVLDLAVAVLIGAAFGKIVDSFVKDILTPIIAPVTPGEAFVDFKIGPLGVGSFINNVLQFLIVAFVLFLIVKAANKIQKPADDPQKPDLAAQNVEQNEKIIALLEQIAAKK